jgi:hypothetical protein
MSYYREQCGLLRRRYRRGAASCVGDTHLDGRIAGPIARLEDELDLARIVLARMALMMSMWRREVM